MNKKLKVNCDYCGEPIERIPTKSGTHFCDNNCKGKWQKKQREDLGYTKEWLYNEYFVLKKPADQIAREIKRDPKSVWRWIKEYGYDLRPRGTDYGQCFQLGDESAFKGKKHTEEFKEKVRQKRLQDGHVPYLQNGVHWLKNEGNKPPSYKGGITPERQAVYSSTEWVDAVKEVWKRDNAICQRCGKKHNDEQSRGTFHIHHIVSFMVIEKRTKIDNLILVCYDCHKFIHSKKNINKEFIGDE